MIRQFRLPFTSPCSSVERILVSWALQVSLVSKLLRNRLPVKKVNERNFLFMFPWSVLERILDKYPTGNIQPELTFYWTVNSGVLRDRWSTVNRRWTSVQNRTENKSYVVSWLRTSREIVFLMGGGFVCFVDWLVLCIRKTHRNCVLSHHGTDHCLNR